MSDNFSANAELSFDTTDFIASANAAAKALDLMEEKSEQASDSFEATKVSEDALSDALRESETVVAALARKYDELVRSLSAATKAQNALDIASGKVAAPQKQTLAQRDAAAGIRAVQAEEAARKKEAATALRLNQQKEASERKLANMQMRARRDMDAEFERRAKKHMNTDQGLSQARYALYDVSTAFTAVSAAALGTVGAIQAVGVSYEKDFASVVRTSGLTVQSDIDALRESLVGLSTDIPVDFANITAIGTLAGQLGVAAEDIASFTEVVAMFSASTNVSVEKSAEDIGRVAQLTGVAGDQYENLASSIYQVGVTSVATESAILETATNISTAGNLAGFTSAQIVALSGAFASLGVAPERARGSVQRIFGELTDAASAGGKQLEAFARVSNMSAADFATTWKGDPQAAFNAFIEGIGNAHRAGQDTNAMLKELGVNAVRDIQAVQVLANNFEVYADAQKEANNGFLTGSALSEGYAITAETTAAKIQVLANQFKALLDTMSDSEALGFAVEMLTRIAWAADKLLGNPVGQFFVTMAGSIAIAVGVYALYNAAVARATASAYANRTAMERMRKETTGVQTGFRGMVTELVHMTQVLRSLDASAGKTSVALKSVGTSAQVAGAQVATGTAAIQASTGATTTAAVAQGRMTAALSTMGAAARTAGAGLATLTRFFLPMAAVTAVVGLGSTAWNLYEKSAENAGDRAKRVFGDLSDFASAVRSDTEEWEKHNRQVAAGEKVTNEAAGSYKTLTVSVKDSERALKSSEQAVSDALGVSVKLTDANSEVVDTYDKMTVALGNNTAAVLYNKFASGEQFDQLVEYQQRLSKFNFGEIEGFDFGEMIKASLDPDNGGAEAYLDQYIARVKSKLTELNNALNITHPDAQQFTSEKERLAVQAQRDEYVRLNKVLLDIKESAKDSDSVITSISSQFPVASSVAKAFGDVVGGVSDELDEATREAETFAESFESLTGALSATAAVEGALYDLGEAVYKNGVEFDVYSENGRANFNALGKTISAMSEQAGSDTDAFVQNLVLMLGELDGMGVQTGNELGYVYDMIANLALPADLGLDTSAARADIRTFIESAITALEARAKLEREGAQSATGISAGASAEQWKAYQDQVNNAGKEAERQAAALRALLTALDNQKEGAKRAGSATQGYRDAVDKATEAAKKNTKATKDQAKAVRTYADYASDLASVLDRSFELQFGNQMAADDVLDAQDAVADVYAKQNAYIQDQKDKIKDARQAILEYDASINKLKADINGFKASNKILEYQLGIARKYGNTLAEESILAEIGANNAKIGESEAEISGLQDDRTKATRDLTKATLDLAQAQEDLKKGLTGNSKFARELRDAMWGLVAAQNAELVQMAKNGASQDELKKKAREHRDQIKGLGDEYGISTRKIQPFITAVNNSIRAINTVPRDVTVTLRYKKDGSVDTVGTAYKELKAKTVTATVRAKADDKSIRETQNKINGIKPPPPVKAKVEVSGTPSFKRLSAADAKEYAKLTQDAFKALDKGDYGQYTSKLSQATRFYNNRARFWSGGFTGRGGKYEAAGIVDRGEFVIPKEHVNQSTGIPNLSALGFMFRGMAMPAKSAASTSSGSTGIQLVEILPNQLQAIVDASQVLVNLDLASLASGINRINEQNNVRGTS